MSNLLEEAIIDAEALRKAAMDNATNVVLEKYADEIKKTVNMVLEGAVMFGQKTEEEDPFDHSEDQDPKPLPKMEPTDMNDPNDGLNPSTTEFGPDPMAGFADDEEVVLDFDALKDAVDAEANVVDDLGFEPTDESLPHEELVMEGVEYKELASSAIEDIKFRLNSKKGQPLSGTSYKVGQTIKFGGADWLIYDHDAVGKDAAHESQLVLVSPDFKKMARYVPLTLNEESAMSTGSVEGSACGFKDDDEIEITEENIQKLMESIEMTKLSQAETGKVKDAREGDTPWQPSVDIDDDGQTDLLEAKNTGWEKTIMDDDPQRYEVYSDNKELGVHIEVRNEKMEGNGWVVYASKLVPGEGEKQYFYKTGLKSKEAGKLLSQLKANPGNAPEEAGEENEFGQRLRKNYDSDGNPIFNELDETVLEEETEVKVDHTTIPSGNSVGANNTDYSLAVEAMKNLIKEKDTGYAEEKKELKKQIKNIQENYNKLVDEKKTLLINTKQLIEKLTESNLRSGKLLYMNRVLRNLSLNERQKKLIAESIERTGTLEEAKAIFESSNAVSSVQEKPVRETLKEAANFRNRTSSLNSGDEAEGAEENPAFARMRQLAFGNKKN